MLVQHIKKLLILAAALLIAACVHTVPLYTPPPPQASATPVVKTNYTLGVGGITDARPDVNPKLIFSADGLTQYGGLFPADYFANEPLTVVINQNLASALVSAHYPLVSTNATYILVGNLLSVRTEVTPGTIYRNNLRTTIQMNLALINTRTNTIVWHQNYTGVSLIEPDALPSDSDVRTAFDGAMHNITDQLVASPSFIQALHGKIQLKKCHGRQHCKLIF